MAGGDLLHQQNTSKEKKQKKQRPQLGSHPAGAHVAVPGDNAKLPLKAHSRIDFLCTLCNQPYAAEVRSRTSKSNKGRCTQCKKIDLPNSSAAKEREHKWQRKNSAEQP